MFDFKNESESDGTQHPQWCRSMSNIKHIYNTLNSFVLAFTVSEMLTFTIFSLSKLGQGRGVQHSQRFHSMANINFYKKNHSSQFNASTRHF